MQAPYKSANDKKPTTYQYSRFASFALCKQSEEEKREMEEVELLVILFDCSTFIPIRVTSVVSILQCIATYIVATWLGSS